MKAIVVGYGLAGMVFHAPLLKAAGIEVAAVVVRDDISFGENSRATIKITTILGSRYLALHPAGPG
ncbi:MAG: hypothetical protein WBO07_03850, partial [Formosimonas sp.]